MVREMESASRGWPELAERALRAEGGRRGEARRAVVAVFAEHDCCLSASEVAAKAAERGERIGTASVYRTVELLRERGLLQRVETGEGGARYEAVVPGGHHHHHAVCERCGRLTPFEDRSLERAINSIAERIGHRVDAHDVLLRGVCERCDT